jgi:beta-lactamase class A
VTSLSRRHMLVTTAGLFMPRVLARAQTGGESRTLSALEARAGGRLGVCILDTQTGRHIGNRLDERFAMCSTFKLPLAAVVLREADRGRLRLDERIAFSEKDMLSHAPVTGKHLTEGGMTIVALAEAAQVTSDNVAANLLIRRLGGPAAFTTLLGALGDRVTRLDRYEPTMNLVLPGEVNDTTTPRAMAMTISQCLTGGLLTSKSRDLLVSWMIATQTGSKRIRAGLPKDWRSGDKTGTATAATMTDKCNDVAVAWPPGKAPMIVAAYFDSAVTSAETRDEDQAVLAEVGRIAAAWALA